MFNLQFLHDYSTFVFMKESFKKIKIVEFLIKNEHTSQESLYSCSNKEYIFCEINLLFLQNKYCKTWCGIRFKAK